MQKPRGSWNKNNTKRRPRGYNIPVEIPIVYVKWFDSTSDDEWEGISEVLEPHNIVTVGWFIAETDDYITVALNIDGESEDEPLVSQKISIPKVNILEKRKWRIKNPCIE